MGWGSSGLFPPPLEATQKDICPITSGGEGTWMGERLLPKRHQVLVNLPSSPNKGVCWLDQAEFHTVAAQEVSAPLSHGFLRRVQAGEGDQGLSTGLPAEVV